MSAEPVVLVSEDDGVLVITLNRPAVRNAVDEEAAQAIAAALWIGWTRRPRCSSGC